MSENSENPLAPPAADLTTIAKPRPGPPLKAVLLGFAVHFGGSNVAGVLVVAVYGVSLARSGMTPETLAEAVSQKQLGSWPWNTNIAIRCAFSMLGGYEGLGVDRQALGISAGSSPGFFVFPGRDSARCADVFPDDARGAGGPYVRIRARRGGARGCEESRPLTRATGR